VVVHLKEPEEAWEPQTVSLAAMELKPEEA
jgi:hypothetical protein